VNHYALRSNNIQNVNKYQGFVELYKINTSIMALSIL